MTKRERVINSIHKKNEDGNPYQLDLTQGKQAELAAYFNDDEFLYNHVGNYLIREKNKNHRIIDDTRYKDIFGVIWKTEQKGGDIGTVENYVFTEPDINMFEFPVPDETLINEKCERMINEHPDLFKIYEIGFSLFERAWTLRGMEDLLTDFILEPAFVDALLDKILEYNLGVIEIAARFPIDCIMFGDDWGQQNGLIMGFRHWERFIKPRMAKMYAAVKKHGLYVCQHSCGDNRELFSSLADMGLDIYNTFQPEIYDVEAFQEAFGKRIKVYGGISTQGVLAKGKPEDVKDAVRQMKRRMGKNYIIAPTHQITEDIPLDNILAFIDAIREAL